METYDKKPQDTKLRLFFSLFIDISHDMFIGMVYSHGYANVLMAVSTAASVAMTMADSYDSLDSTQSIHTIMSVLAATTATATSIAGCDTDDEPAWLNEAADTPMHTLHVQVHVVVQLYAKYVDLRTRRSTHCRRPRVPGNWIHSVG